MFYNMHILFTFYSMHMLQTLSVQRARADHDIIAVKLVILYIYNII
jgi:hypothetical protein